MVRLLAAAFLASLAPLAAEEIVFRPSGGTGEPEVIRGKVLGQDEDGNLRIQIINGVITRSREDLVEVRPDLADALFETLEPERPAEYLEAAGQVLARIGSIDLGEPYSPELARRLVAIAIQLDPDLHVAGYRILTGRLDGSGNRTGGVENPFDVARYAHRILLVAPDDEEALSILLAARAQAAESLEGIPTKVAIFLRLYATKRTADFLRLARPFAAKDTPEARALAGASLDGRIEAFLDDAFALACDSCRLTGETDCRRCEGRGSRRADCPTCKGRGGFRRDCGACKGKGKFHPNPAIVGAYEKCRQCEGSGRALYACETCLGDRTVPRPCEDCGARGRFPCARCGGDLWRGLALPDLSFETALEIADRCDPAGTAEAGAAEVESAALASGDSAEGIFDPTPLAPLGARLVDEAYEGTTTVVFHAGRWMTVAEKEEARLEEARLGEARKE